MQNTQNTAAAIMEVVLFQIDSIVSEQAFLTLFRQTESLLRGQPGFVSRQLIRAEDGVWSDLVLWRSRAEAEAAAAQVMADPAFAPFMAAIRPESVEMSHQRLMATMAG